MGVHQNSVVAYGAIKHDAEAIRQVIRSIYNRHMTSTDFNVNEIHAMVCRELGEDIKLNSVAPRITEMSQGNVQKNHAPELVESRKEIYAGRGGRTLQRSRYRKMTIPEQKAWLERKRDAQEHLF